MKNYPMSLGFEVWNAFENGYMALTTPPLIPTVIKLSDNNPKAKNAILCGLVESVFVKFIHYASTKKIWDKLQKLYEGDDKVKKEKLQTYRGQLKPLR
jgi:hypothetical protein